MALAFSTQAVGFLFIAPIAFLAPGSITARGLSWGGAAAAAGVIGWWCLYAAMAIGQIAVVSKLKSGTAALLPFTVGIATGFRPSWSAIGGLLAIVLALILLSAQPPNPRAGGDPKKVRTSVSLAFMSGVGMGFALVALGQTTSQDGVWPFMFYRLGAAVVLAVLAIVWAIRLWPPTEKVRSIFAIGLLSTIGDVAVIYALQRGPFALIPAVTALHPMVTAVLARYLGREILRRIQVCAIVIGVSGLMMLQY
jgi:drug/metabolite transporter (DMT)-like permease